MIKGTEPKDLSNRLFIILVRPESLENIGLAARAMKNTGFHNLRVVGRRKVEITCPRTAVHAKEIIKEAAFFPDLASATDDLHTVFASTAKRRKNFSVLSFEEAMAKIFSFPGETRVGLLFGNERTGLTSAELSASNFRWSIPQAARQPSYNLAAAVLITLFELFRRGPDAKVTADAPDREMPLPRKDQEECISLILQKLERRMFIHSTNKRHSSQMVRDLLGRLAMTDRDRKLLLAMFSQTGWDE
jgi:TrmH family RNA methyltransferase